MRAQYARVVAAAKTGKRLDVTARRAVTRLAEAAGREDHGVPSVFRELGRAALTAGDPAGLEAAARYAHASVRAPGQELVALQSLGIELMAIWAPAV